MNQRPYIRARTFVPSRQSVLYKETEIGLNEGLSYSGAVRTRHSTNELHSDYVVADSQNSTRRSKKMMGNQKDDYMEGINKFEINDVNQSSTTDTDTFKKDSSATSCKKVHKGTIMRSKVKSKSHKVKTIKHHCEQKLFEDFVHKDNAENIGEQCLNKTSEESNFDNKTVLRAPSRSSNKCGSVRMIKNFLQDLKLQASGKEPITTKLNVSEKSSDSRSDNPTTDGSSELSMSQFDYSSYPPATLSDVSCHLAACDVNDDNVVKKLKADEISNQTEIRTDSQKQTSVDISSKPSQPARGRGRSMPRKGNIPPSFASLSASQQNNDMPCLEDIPSCKKDYAASTIESEQRFKDSDVQQPNIASSPSPFSNTWSNKFYSGAEVQGHMTCKENSPLCTAYPPPIKNDQFSIDSNISQWLYPTIAVQYTSPPRINDLPGWFTPELAGIPVPPPPIVPSTLTNETIFNELQDKLNYNHIAANNNQQIISNCSTKTKADHKSEFVENKQEMWPVDSQEVEILNEKSFKNNFNIKSTTSSTSTPVTVNETREKYKRRPQISITLSSRSKRDEMCQRFNIRLKDENEKQLFHRNDEASAHLSLKEVNATKHVYASDSLAVNKSVVYADAFDETFSENVDNAEPKISKESSSESSWIAVGVRNEHPSQLYNSTHNSAYMNLDSKRESVSSNVFVAKGRGNFVRNFSLVNNSLPMTRKDHISAELGDSINYNNNNTSLFALSDAKTNNKMLNCEGDSMSSINSQNLSNFEEMEKLLNSSASPQDVAINKRRKSSRFAPEVERNTQWTLAFQSMYNVSQVPFIDSHCHLDMIFDRCSFKGSFKDFHQQNSESFVKNFEGCLTVFCKPRVLRLDLVSRLLDDDNVWGAVGVHPKDATSFNENIESRLRVLLTHPKVKAAGEMGLDYSGTFYQHAEVQKTVFERQLAIAIELHKPIVIHCRDAEADCVDIVSRMVPSTTLIHRHCWTGTWQDCEAWLTRFPNSYIGLTPLVTYLNENTVNTVRQVAMHIPLDRLLLETDAPYFIPSKVSKDDFPLSHPGMAVTVAVEVAKIKRIALDEVLIACRKNTIRMYNM